MPSPTPRTSRGARHGTRPFFAVTAAALATLLLLLSILSASPQLHHALHHGECTPDSPCAVNLLSTHGLAPADTLVSLVTPTAPAPSPNSVPANFSPSSVCLWTAPGRGPPCSGVPSTLS